MFAEGNAGIWSGIGDIRCVFGVFWVLVMRCLYADKVPVSMWQPETVTQCSDIWW